MIPARRGSKKHGSDNTVLATVVVCLYHGIIGRTAVSHLV
jgi:hypothetical protein